MNRRTFVKQGGLATTALVGKFLGIGRVWAQSEMTPVPRLIETPPLTIAYEEMVTARDSLSSSFTAFPMTFGPGTT